MEMSPTSEDTILPKAAPMMTPTARSTTLPFIANSLNSDARLIADLPNAPHEECSVLLVECPNLAIESLTHTLREIL